MKRALGREKRANMMPVITASISRPAKISIMATVWPYRVWGCMSP